ncbi:MAG: T9SS type A sorting domain-containing protein [Bacteroidota bacterium]|nr:T9SS type A sorting domain-containing protein [Bacteroidota bacterium]
MKNLLKVFSYLFIFLSTAYSQWIPIDSVRVQDSIGVPLLLNQSITTRGIVTTHREFGGSLVYFQTRTAGLIGFDTAFCNRVKRGDSIEVTGVVTQFSGLTELNPVTSLTILDTGKTVTPTLVTCTQVRVDGERYEGMLIRISNVTSVHTLSGVPVTTWAVGGSGTNYRLIAGNDSCDIRIYATTNIANQPIHAFPFDIVSECSQFKFSAPFIGGYQILPRSLDDFSPVTGINIVSNNIGDKYTLHQNYPNPFNPKTIINYELGIANFVILKVFDVIGNEVVNLVNEKQNAGSYEVEFDGSRLSSGIYFYKLESGNFFETKKMILLK